MNFNLIEINDRIFALNRAELCAPKRVRQKFNRALRLIWVYHQLNVEGVVVTHDDLKRALQGKKGDDYCDNLLLERARAFDKLFSQLQEASQKREPLSVKCLFRFHATLGHDTKLRKKEGATEQYKHPVADPVELDIKLKSLLEEIEQRSFMENPVLLATELHYRITMIWPLTEDNAIIARAFADLLLMRFGYPPMLIHADDRRKYYHALYYDISRIRSLQIDSLKAMIKMRSQFFSAYIARAERKRFAVA